MHSVRTCFFIAAFLCLSQQAVFAEETVETSAPLHPVEEVDASMSPTEEAIFDPELSQTEDGTTDLDDESPTTTDMLSEIIIRPISVVASATGLAIFIGGSPFSGLASIPEPHDTFKITWDDFVVTPYYFTFRRPLGDYSVELN